MSTLKERNTAMLKNNVLQRPANNPPQNISCSERKIGRGHGNATQITLSAPPPPNTPPTNPQTKADRVKVSVARHAQRLVIETLKQKAQELPGGR